MSLRTRLPDAFIAARAINIEPLQHLDNHGLFPRRGPVWLLYGMLRLGVSDVTHRRKADAIYPISEWEGRVYWRRLPGGSCVKWVPYFSPDFVLSGRHGERKEQLIACVPGSASYPRNKDAVVRFLKFAEIARRVAPDYRFVITGDLRDSGIAVPGFVEVPGLIEDVAELLGAAKAVAVLSPRGYGFKTTVADAVANGCYALVHPLQYARGPVVLRDGCIPLDAITHCSVERTLERLDKPFPSFQGNAHLRDRAIEVLRHDFLSTKNG